MTIIAWLVIGLLAGALARLIVPGRDPMGFFATMVLGIVGSFIGGFLGYVLFGKDLDEYRSRIFRKEYLPRIRPFPKVRDLFQRIRDDEKKIVLASSGKKDDTKYYIKLLKIDNLIEGCTSADDADRSKPAPDLFTAAREKLGDFSAAEVINIGDTRFDIEAAAKAGLRTIALTCGGTPESVLKKAGAIAVYYDPADLLIRYETLPI